MPKITIIPADAVAEVEPGTLLLEAGEAAGVEMEAGCFSCSCGACVVEVVQGMEHLEPPTAEELDVLDEWNRDSARYRLACCTRIQQGDVAIRQAH
jgi:ferredoxin